jgi:hypothetical protein
MNAFKALLSSKRIQSVLLGALVAALAKWKLDPAIADTIVEVVKWGVGLFVGGQSVVDAASRGATSHSAAAKDS